MKNIIYNALACCFLISCTSGDSEVVYRNDHEEVFETMKIKNGYFYSSGYVNKIKFFKEGGATCADMDGMISMARFDRPKKGVVFKCNGREYNITGCINKSCSSYMVKTYAGINNASTAPVYYEYINKKGINDISFTYYYKKYSVYNGGINYYHSDQDNLFLKK